MSSKYSLRMTVSLGLLWRWYTLRLCPTIISTAKTHRAGLKINKYKARYLPLSFLLETVEYFNIDKFILCENSFVLMLSM